MTRFSGASWPRRRIETPEITRTAWGTPQERGTSYEPPHLWQVAALVSDLRAPGTFSEADTLEAMYSRWLVASGDLVLHDYTRDYSEAAPRTRQLAAGRTATTVGTTVRYAAQFNVRFSGELTLERQDSTGTMVLASFQLIETTRRPA